VLDSVPAGSAATLEQVLDADARARAEAARRIAAHHAGLRSRAS
jgi:hypothetical protein